MNRIVHPETLVVVESPYAGNVEENEVYLIECFRDCFERAEAPFASHELYTRALDDLDPIERTIGINAGLLWAERAEKRAVYIDLGISAGMRQGIAHAKQCEQIIEYRRLYPTKKTSVVWSPGGDLEIPDFFVSVLCWAHEHPVAIYRRNAAETVRDIAERAADLFGLDKRGSYGLQTYREERPLKPDDRIDQVSTAGELLELTQDAAGV